MDFGGADGVVEDEDFNIYTGLRSGEIMKIHPSKDGEVGEGKQEIFFEAQFQKLAKTDPKAQHGRPLGLLFNLKNFSFYEVLHNSIT